MPELRDSKCRAGCWMPVVVGRTLCGPPLQRRRTSQSEAIIQRRDVIRTSQSQDLNHLMS